MPIVHKRGILHHTRPLLTVPDPSMYKRQDQYSYVRSVLDRKHKRGDGADIPLGQRNDGN